MSDKTYLLLALAAVCIAICSIAFIPWLLATKNKDAKKDDYLRDSTGGLIKMLRPIIRIYSHFFVEGKINKQKLDRIATRLQTAGLGYVLTASEFIVLQRLSSFFSILFASFIIWLSDTKDPVTILSTIIVIISIGYFYPDIWLRDKVKQRQQEIEKNFPFFLDLLVLSLRAGLPFAGAVQLGLGKMKDGPLKYELSRYQRDIRTGMNRAVALERFSSIISLSSVTNFVASIIQAEETGGSITRLLEEQAKQRRKERFLRAEKKANEAPVKMLLPLVGLLFPITFIIIAVPIAVQFMESGLVDKLFK
jgi:tight adherence protein C